MGTSFKQGYIDINKFEEKMKKNTEKIRCPDCNCIMEKFDYRAEINVCTNCHKHVSAIEVKK